MDVQHEEKKNDTCLKLKVRKETKKCIKRHKLLDKDNDDNNSNDKESGCAGITYASREEAMCIYIYI